MEVLPGQRGRGYHATSPDGDLLSWLDVVVVVFKASHAQRDASAHNDSIAGDCGLGTISYVWLRPAITAFSIKLSAPFVTIIELGLPTFNWGLSAAMNSCLIPLGLHSSTTPPGICHNHLIDRLPPWEGHSVHNNPEGSARAVRRCPTCGAQCSRTYVCRQNSSGPMRVHHFLPRDSYHLRLSLESTKLLPR